METTHHPVTGDLLARLVCRTWIDSTPEGLVGMLLLTPGGGVTSETMQALADAAGLADGGQPMPDCGVQVLVEGTDVRIALRGTDLSVIVPAAPRWSAFIAQGNPVVILLGTRPLDPAADRTTIDRHLLAEVQPGRILMGKTRVSGLWTAEQLAGEACLRCGSAEPPLHPDGTIPVPVSDGVVRDTPVVRCTPCLVIR